MTIIAPGSVNSSEEESATPYTQYNSQDNINPVFGVGTIRRNPDYTGPALRVINDVTDEEVDVEFDEYGRVSGDLPYGSDTRLITLYDQWGSEDLTADKSRNILISVNDDTEFFTWQISFISATGSMATPSIAEDNPPWTVPDPIWVIGHKRNGASGLRTLWMINHAGGGYMANGLWMEHADLHMRVDGGGGSDWVNTDWYGNPTEAQNFATAISDVTQQDGNAYAYYNGVADLVYSFSNPIDTYNDNSALYLGGQGSLGNPFNGWITELHLFERVANADSDDVALLHNGAMEVTQNPDTMKKAASGQEAAENIDAYLGNTKWQNTPYVDIGVRHNSTWSAASDVIVVPTIGITFRSGVIGQVRVDTGPGSDIDFEIRDENDTVVATGTILSAETDGDLTAASDATISKEVKLYAVDTNGSATLVDLAIRGEAS